MLENALELKEPLTIFFAMHDSLLKDHESKLTIDSNGWSKFEIILKYLNPFKIATNMVCAEKYPTISLVTPIYNKLLEHVNHWIVERCVYGDKLHKAAVSSWEKLNKYYCKIPICVTIATVLDPRFNLSFYESDISINRVPSKEIEEVVKNIYLKNYSPTIVESEEEVNDASNFSFLFKKTVFSADDELNAYFNERNIYLDKFIDVINWWKSAMIKYPNVSRMARDYLAIPATSTSSERLFSSASDLITDNRNSLKPSTIRECQCLKSWI